MLCYLDADTSSNPSGAVQAYTVDSCSNFSTNQLDAWLTKRFLESFAPSRQAFVLHLRKRLQRNVIPMWQMVSQVFYVDLGATIPTAT
jgi:hypothetical protein